MAGLPASLPGMMFWIHRRTTGIRERTFAFIELHSQTVIQLAQLIHLEPFQEICRHEGVGACDYQRNLSDNPFINVRLEEFVNLCPADHERVASERTRQC